MDIYYIYVKLWVQKYVCYVLCASRLGCEHLDRQTIFIYSRGNFEEHHMLE